MRAAGVTARYHELQSAHGHDGFLAEAEQLIPLVNAAFDDSSCADRQLSVAGAVS
jgi:homoserine acetyltransferase